MIFNILYGPGTAREKFLCIVAFLISALFAIMVHEVSHGYVAKLNGDNTAKMMGRLTLNPVKHFDPIGFLMFALVGFGWAKPVPINPNNFKNYKRGIITTSLAGVTSNLLLSFVNFGLLVATQAIAGAAGITNQVGEVFYLLFFYMFLYGTMINISLLAFNLIPVYPLDGFHVLEMITRPNNKVVMFLRRYGYYMLIGVLLIGSVIPGADFIGMYLRWVQSGLLNLFSMIFGGF